MPAPSEETLTPKPTAGPRAVRGLDTLDERPEPPMGRGASTPAESEAAGSLNAFKSEEEV